MGISGHLTNAAIFAKALVEDKVVIDKLSHYRTTEKSLSVLKLCLINTQHLVNINQQSVTPDRLSVRYRFSRVT